MPLFDYKICTEVAVAENLWNFCSISYFLNKEKLDWTNLLFTSEELADHSTTKAKKIRL